MWNGTGEMDAYKSWNSIALSCRQELIAEQKPSCLGRNMANITVDHKANNQSSSRLLERQRKKLLVIHSVQQANFGNNAHT